MSRFSDAQDAIFAERMIRATRPANTATTHPDRHSHDAQVARLLRAGYRIEIQTAEATQLVKGRPVNHVLHLLLSVFTAGLWLPVWVLVAIHDGEKRQIIAR